MGRVRQGRDAELLSMGFGLNRGLGRGGCQGRIGIHSDGFLRRRAEGSLTPNLVVTEFWRGYGQTDLASACAAPLESLGPVLQDGWGDGVSEQGPGYTGPEFSGGGCNKGRGSINSKW